MVIYRRNLAYNPCVHDLKLLKDIHYFISDKKVHNIAFVQNAFLFHWNFLKSKGCFSKNHIIRSDGCLAKFRSSKAWYFVAKYPSLTTLARMPSRCHMMWNFFTSGHGKGKVDGARALSKREIQKE